MGRLGPRLELDRPVVLHGPVARSALSRHRVVFAPMGAAQACHESGLSDRLEQRPVPPEVARAPELRTHLAAILRDARHEDTFRDSSSAMALNQSSRRTTRRSPASAIKPADCPHSGYADARAFVSEVYPTPYAQRHSRCVPVGLRKQGDCLADYLQCQQFRMAIGICDASDPTSSAADFYGIGDSTAVSDAASALARLILATISYHPVRAYRTQHGVPSAARAADIFSPRSVPMDSKLAGVGLSRAPRATPAQASQPACSAGPQDALSRCLRKYTNTLSGGSEMVVGGRRRSSSGRGHRSHNHLNNSPGLIGIVRGVCRGSREEQTPAEYLWMARRTSSRRTSPGPRGRI